MADSGGGEGGGGGGDTATTVLIIVNCVRYAHKAERQRRTWIPASGLHAPNCPIWYYHVTGDPSLESAFVRRAPHQLVVRAPDTYAGLPQKMRAAFAAVRALHPRMTLLFKTDDDQCSVVPGFLTKMHYALQQWRERGTHYGGYIIRVPKAHFSTLWRDHPEMPRNLLILPIQYCSGRFYFLSVDAIDALLALQPDPFPQEMIEDYAVGKHLPAEFTANMVSIPTERYFTDCW
jgi:hypothetical protein